ncbi:hypothetical protein STTU_4320 [Streptomyces sp. Tu6071]|nr:hypothetical protein STTU_4320 [Streptomyces sp. Tu6071]
MTAASPLTGADGGGRRPVSRRVAALFGFRSPLAVVEGDVSRAGRRGCLPAEGGRGSRSARGGRPAGEAEAGHGAQDLGGAEVAVVLAGDDLSDLFGGVAAASDDDEVVGDRLGLDAPHRFQHAVSGQVEREAGDDAAHDASRGGADERAERGRCSAGGGERAPYTVLVGGGKAGSGEPGGGRPGFARLMARRGAGFGGRVVVDVAQARPVRGAGAAGDVGEAGEGDLSGAPPVLVADDQVARAGGGHEGERDLDRHGVPDLRPGRGRGRPTP